jgi:antitoxin component of RelBE/YafQ-DinJ toxin-antitoxin module
MGENEARQPSPRRPNGSEAYPVRSVRISDGVWAKAKARSEREGVTVSRVASLLIEGYADGALNLPVTVLIYDNPETRAALA